MQNILNDDQDNETLCLDKLSHNHMLRYFSANNFDPEEAARKLKEDEKWLVDNNMWDIISKEEFKSVLALKAFAALNSDKLGRPNLYFKLSKYWPNMTSVEELQKFLVIVIDNMCCKMDEKVD